MQNSMITGKRGRQFRSGNERNSTEYCKRTTKIREIMLQLAK